MWSAYRAAAMPTIMGAPRDDERCLHTYPGHDALTRSVMPRSGRPQGRQRISSDPDLTEPGIRSSTSGLR
jgi:hypothetical protein